MERGCAYIPTFAQMIPPFASIFYISKKRNLCERKINFQKGRKGPFPASSRPFKNS
jgi:hypothetical protein